MAYIDTDSKNQTNGDIMDIDNLTLGQIKNLKNIFAGDKSSCDCGPYKIGQAYFIRTVTMSFTGIITAVHNAEIELSTACWISDSGRFNLALKGEWDASAEHEPYPAPIIIGRGSIIDACPISFSLPTKVK